MNHDSDYTDTTFNWDNVYRNADIIGAERGIIGPYYYRVERKAPDSYTHTLNGQKYTIRHKIRFGILTGTVSVADLAAELFTNERTAFWLHRRVLRMHETADVWTDAVARERGRAEFAARLAARKAAAAA